MIEDFEDDTHFCLKCHTTIIGLDNYVSHRKAGCAKPVEELPKSPLPSQLLPPDESFNLKADDFFSSLELQSSSKKPPPSTTGKNFSGILTRSKTTAAIQATQHKDSEIPQSKSGKNVWIGGLDQLKLGHGDNQSKLIKAVDELEQRKEVPLIGVYEESDVESDEYEYEDESSEDENHDAPPRNHTGGKWKPSSPIQWNRDWNVPPPSFTGGKWKPTSKRASPPPSHTKGKWKPPEPLNLKESFDFPPPTFTGSKWSHSKNKHESETSKKDETKIKAKSSYTGGKWKPTLQPPSPSYTKGKWTSSSHEPKKSKISDDSPFRKSSGMVQYWCRPCNRRLASKVVYERHLKSELHYKRALHDNEFDDNLITPIERRKKKISESAVATSSKPTILKKRQRRRIYTKCEVCKSRVNNAMIGKHLISHYHCRKGDISSPTAQAMVLENIDKIIFQSPFQCGICRFYFNHNSNFLKHWQSEIHSLKAHLLEGYFWCALCKFRTEDSELMYTHLTSQEHQEVVSVINRSVPIVIKKINPLKCSDCTEEFLLNVELKKHCQMEKHTLPDLVNKNFVCLKCDQIFRSNVSLKRHKLKVHNENVFICTVCDLNFKTKEEARLHRGTTAHSYKVSAQQNDCKERRCDYCNEISSDLPSLKEHLRTQHSEFNPRCPQCGVTFVLPQELTVHLRTKACSYGTNFETGNSCDKCSFTTTSTSELLFHKVLHTEPLIRLPDEKRSVPSYKCPLCEKIFPKSSLQAHLRVHSNERPYVCNFCQKGFVRKNNWVLHVRNHTKNADKELENKEIQPGTSSTETFVASCDKCPFSSNSTSELLFHKVRHTEPLMTVSDKQKTGLYKCPLCNRLFPKSSMQAHLRLHTKERPYVCDICKSSFVRKKTLVLHVKNHATRDAKELEKKEKEAACGNRPFLCSTCGTSFGKKFILQQHMATHTGRTCKCPKAGCVFSARNMSELKRHFKSHTNGKTFACTICDYRGNSNDLLQRHLTVHNSTKKYSCPKCPYTTRTSSHLKRHIRLHTGSKPYNCPHCNYKCNNLENLRKHVLSTNKHRGKYIFECKFDCTFQTNFAKDFKAHLFKNHPGIFKNNNEAASYVAGIYDSQDDSTVLQEEDFEDPKEESKAKVIVLQQNEEPIASTSKNELPISPVEIFPMFIVSRDEGPSDHHLVERYDVEESGVLVPFNPDNVLFEDNF